jgi:hypothetical protein
MIVQEKLSRWSLVIVLIVALLLRAVPLQAQGSPPTLKCNGPAVEFEQGLPLDWSVDTPTPPAGGFDWTDSDLCGESGNFTGGSGKCACASAAANPSIHVFETRLESNSFSLAGLSSATLSFQVNYHSLSISDHLILEASTDGGMTWNTLKDWSNGVDLGALRGTPGAPVTINLGGLLGSSGVKLRWNYQDGFIGSNEYAQIDSVKLTCFGGLDVAIDQQVSAAEVLEGEEIDFTITMTNNSSIPLPMLYAWNTFDPNLTLLEVDFPTGMLYYGYGNLMIIMAQNIGAGTSVQGSFTAAPALFRTATLQITSPASLAGEIDSLPLDIAGRPPLAKLSADIIQVVNSSVSPPPPTSNDACNSPTNMTDINGEIALADWGSDCSMLSQILNTQVAGAAALLIISSGETLYVPDGVALTPLPYNFVMPAFLIKKSDGDKIKAQLAGGVTASIQGSLPDSGQIKNKLEVSATFPDPDYSNNISETIITVNADHDHDQIKNSSDNCPKHWNTKQEDADKDGTGDACDTCTDKDGDGAGDPGYDANTCAADGCPSDPNKTAPGVCGCGTADVDANGNGVMDCQSAEELKAQVDELRSLVKSLKKKVSKKLKAQQTQTKTDIKNLLASINTLVGSSGADIASTKNISNLNKLIKRANRSVNKALKTKAAKFAANKKKALRALRKLSKKL